MEKSSILPDGIYAMLVTPLDTKQRVNYGALQKELEWCADQGANGAVVTPSIGEFACLHDAERWECFYVCAEFAKHHLSRSFRLIAGTADTCTEKMLSHAERAKNCGYHAMQLNAPYYWGIEEDQVWRYYESAVKTGLPVVVYNNPRLSKFEMSRKFLGELSKLEGVVSIKETKTDPHVDLEPLFEAVNPVDAKIFTTFRVFFDGYMLHSNGGFINVFALPSIIKLWKLLNRANSREDFFKARKLQTFINFVFPRGSEGNKYHIATTKAAASLVTGIPMGTPRSPYEANLENYEKRLISFLPTLQFFCDSIAN